MRHLVLLVAALAGLAAAALTATARRERVREHALAWTEARAIALAPPLATADREGVRAILRQASATPGLHRARVLDAAGALIAEVEAQGGRPRSAEVEAPILVDGRRVGTLQVVGSLDLRRASEREAKASAP